MHDYRLDGGTRVTIAAGDLTSQRVDAIVNAANERMLGGGGVDGAIHAAAGPELLVACRAVPEVRPDVRCPTGEARLTPAFRLPARFVIHTVGPVYRSAAESAPLLAQSHVASLRLACAHGLRTVAFPAISCGVYGYPLEDAAAVALATVREHATGLDEVRFVLYGERAFTAWSARARLTFGRSAAAR